MRCSILEEKITPKIVMKINFLFFYINQLEMPKKKIN